MNKLELLQLLTDTLTDDTKSTQDLYNEVQQHLLNQEKTSVISLHRATVKSVKKIRKAEDEWVYDIGMRN
jgi:predicted patatin/cPLA2 family phospholipase